MGAIASMSASTSNRERSSRSETSLADAWADCSVALRISVAVSRLSVGSFINIRSGHDFGHSANQDFASQFAGRLARQPGRSLKLLGQGASNSQGQNLVAKGC